VYGLGTAGVQQTRENNLTKPNDGGLKEGKGLGHEEG